MTEQQTSDRGLGLTTLACLVVASMIGAGIFTSSGFSLAALQSPGRVMLAWWLCGVWAISGAYAYGALVSRLPMSGGEYLFLSRFVSPWVGFLAGWISVIAGFTAPIAAAAQGAAVYCLPNAELGDFRLTLVSAAVIVGATGLHLSGVSVGTRVQNTIVFAKLLLLALIIVWAFGLAPADAWKSEALVSGSIKSWWPENSVAWTELVGSMSWIALSYTGFNAAIYVAGESRDAKRNVPKAMVLATVLVTVLYLLLNYVFLYAPPMGDVIGEESVAAIAAAAIGGSNLEWITRVTIVLAMISSVFAMLLAGPRVYQKMAEDGVMPKMFRTEGGSPRVAIAAQAVASLIAVFATDLLQLMKYLGLTLSACGGIAVLSLWWVRKRLPEARPLTWLEILSMTIYLGITICILWASQITHPVEFRAMWLTFAVGLIVYGGWKYWESTQKTRQSSSV